jgi:ABC-type multidrug transport system fused ATPase/permease subunit
MASVGERVIAELRRELYAHIQGMPLAFFTSLHSGELRARVVNDVGRIARLASLLLVDTVRALGTIIALLVVMWSREWVLALMATVCCRRRASSSGRWGGNSTGSIGVPSSGSVSSSCCCRSLSPARRS